MESPANRSLPSSHFNIPVPNDLEESWTEIFCVLRKFSALVVQDDFERVVCYPVSKGWSRSSGLPCAWGYTDDGRYLIAVYEELNVMTILPVTAFEVPEPR